MEDLLRLGSVKLGAPGICALGLSCTPLLEAMPRIWAERGVGKLPLLPYTAMLTSGMLWCTYGLLAGSPVIFWPNGFGVVLGLFYCTFFWHFCPPGADWLPLSRHHLVFLLVAAGVCVSFPVLLPPTMAMLLLGVLASVLTVVIFAGPLAAIRTVMGDRSTRSLPFAFTCSVSLNCSLWLTYGWFMAGDAFIYVPNFLGLLVACLHLSLFCRFGLHVEPPRAQ